MKQLLIITLILNLTSCTLKENNSEPDVKYDTPNAVLQQTTYKPLTFKCKTDEQLKPSSQLATLASSLAELENNYQIQSIKDSHHSKAILLSGLNKLEKLRLNKRRQNYRITNFNELTNSISVTKFCYVKGTKDFGGKLYARAKIEEITFKSVDCAQNAFEMIEEIRSSHIWEEIDKSPNDVFRRKNRLYYISAGGWYMMDFYKEISKKMNPEQEIH